jgi:hypothetical protein
VLRTAARHPDFIALAITLPIFIAAGWSLIGYAVAATVWVIQAVAQIALQRKVDSSDNPRTVVGLVAGGSMARAWFAAIAVLVTGLIDERAGLAAVVLILVLFTFYFAAKISGHYFDQMGEAVK